jgi:hypothetical protein
LRAVNPEHPGTSSTAGFDMPPAGDRTRNGSAAHDAVGANVTAANHRKRRDLLRRPNSMPGIPACLLGTMPDYSRRSATGRLRRQILELATGQGDDGALLLAAVPIGEGRGLDAERERLVGKVG